MDRMIIGGDLTIQEVSDRLGLPKSTLRYWEKELGDHINPKRTPGGQRRYAQTDMEFLTTICKYKKKGFSLSQIKEHILHTTQQYEEFDHLQIDRLANRIANTVKREIYNFFDQARHEVDAIHVSESQKE